MYVYAYHITSKGTYLSYCVGALCLLRLLCFLNLLYTYVPSLLCPPYYIHLNLRYLVCLATPVYMYQAMPTWSASYMWT